jgi:F-box interacting protein
VQPGHQGLLDQRVAFGFDPCSGTYKVARHFLRSYSQGQIYTEYDVGHEVLTLGDGRETLEWNATIDPPYPIKARTPVCLPGFSYWSAVQSVADADHGKLATDVILRFSMRDDTFTVHPSPPCRSCLSPNDLLCELGGKPCYVHSPSPLEVSIWLAQDGQNIITWSLRCRVNLSIPRSARVFACASADQDTVFLSVDARDLFKCNSIMDLLKQ